MQTLRKLSPAVGLFAAVLVCLVAAACVLLRDDAKPTVATPEVAPPPPEPEPESLEDRAAREIEQVWSMWMDDAGAKASDRRRPKLARYARLLARPIQLYTEHETDIGGRLPQHPDTPLILAVMVAKESSLRPSVIARSSKREIGFGQLHGAAIRPYSRAEVHASQSLQMMLHARWIAYSRSQCPAVPDEEWTLDDWVGPLSMYAGGRRNARRADGGCKRFAKMQDRVNMVRLFRARIAALDGGAAG